MVRGVEEEKQRGSVNDKENLSSNNGAFDVNKLQKLRSKGAKKNDAAVVANKGSKLDTKKKVTKNNRVWDDKPKEVKLDYTHPVAENEDEHVESVAAIEGESMMDNEEVISSDSEEEEDEQVGNGFKAGSKSKGWFSSMFRRLVKG